MEVVMKQRKLIKQLYRACLDHDTEKLSMLRRQEFEKILKRKAEGKNFSTKWALVRI